MEIKVENKIPNTKVVVNKDENGIMHINISEEVQRTLRDINPGETVKLGNYEFIVLGHGGDTTAVLAKKSVKNMRFGDSADYRTSDVRKYINGAFYDEMAAAIGGHNILAHTVKLMADDGTFRDARCKDKVSILTTEQYRRYRPYIPNPDESQWTATRVSEKEFTHCVCVVCSSGVPGWDVYDCCWGVAPFLILNSSILIS